VEWQSITILHMAAHN